MTNPHHPVIVAQAVKRMLKTEGYLHKVSGEGWSVQEANAWKAFCDRHGMRRTEQPEMGSLIEPFKTRVDKQCTMIVKQRRKMGIAEIEQSSKTGKWYRFIPAMLPKPDEESDLTQEQIDYVEEQRKSVRSALRAFGVKPKIKLLGSTLSSNSGKDKVAGKSKLSGTFKARGKDK